MKQRRLKYYIILIALSTLFSACGAERYLRKAEQSYAIGEYYQAASMYKKAYSLTSSNERESRARQAFMMAECYRRINYATRAQAAYQNAIRYNYPDSTVYRYLADMQLRCGEYKKATESYSRYLEYAPNDPLALSGYESSLRSLNLKRNPTRYIVKRDPLFNSRYSDYSPVLGNADGTILYFTSTRDEATGDEINGISGMKSSDIFFSERDDKGKWKRPMKVEGGLNSEYEEGVIAFSPDYSRMYITYCSFDAQLPKPAQIRVAQRSDAAWGASQPYIESDADTLNTYAHPAISPDGEWLYFVSDMSGGYGGYDIWRVPLGDRLIGAENLGPQINTPGNEMFPTFGNDGTLYFSSDGHPGMGGLDIFSAKAVGDTIWRVENMLSPINSYADDFGLTFESIYNRGFFSSNRNDGRGRDHIYSFELPETLHKITGWVYERDGYELPQALVYLVGDDGTNTLLRVRDDGSFVHRVNPNTRYLLLGTSKGYMNYKQEIKSDSTDENREYLLQFPLSSITKPVQVNNIYFDFDRATLREESYASLDSLVVLLNDNPQVAVEIGAHCDYKGNDEYNLQLSARRAQSVVQYLIDSGISASRLTAKGYGEEVPRTVSRKLTELYPFLSEGEVLTENAIGLKSEKEQEICNQLNRRIEFRVTRTSVRGNIY